MTQFHDANAVQWSVHRRWWNVDVVPDPSELGGDFLSLVAGLLCLVVWLPFALAWPFWLLAKFCGVPWKVRIRRNRDVVYTERVRGWSNSRRRLDGISQSLLRGAGEPAAVGGVAAPAASTPPVVAAMPNSGPEAAECLRSMHSWLQRAQQATGPERDAALTSAGEWSSRYEERRLAEGQAAIEAGLRSHWIYKFARGFVMLNVTAWVLMAFSPYLLQLAEHVAGLFSRN